MPADRSLPSWPQRLIELRRAQAWSPADLACELKKLRDGLPSVRSLAHMIQLDWETGKHRPGPRYRLLLAAVYDTDEQQIFGGQNSTLGPQHARRPDGAPDVASATGQTSLVEPSGRAAPEIGEAASLATAGRPSSFRDGLAEDFIDVVVRIQKLSRSVDPEIIRYLRENLLTTIEQYESLDHATILPALLKQRAWVDALLNDCSHPRQRQQLFEIAAAISGVLGYVAVGRGDFCLARAYCIEAFQLGDFAQDASVNIHALCAE
jgi:hypothetical protein